MSKKYNYSVFIFRREYRLKDNIGLINALKYSEHVIPIFIFTPEQVVNNKYKSNNAVQFMVESLEDLNDQLKEKNSKLFYFFGKQHEVINNLIINNKNIDAIFVNRDYTPYANQRDSLIKQVCDKHKIDFISHEDYLLHDIGTIKTINNTIYLKYTPFLNAAKSHKVNNITNNNYNNYIPKSKKFDNEYKDNIHKFYENNNNIPVHGGRTFALNILNNITRFRHYNEERNILSISTTRLSAYIKFGCVSCREVYWAIKNKLGMKNELIKQLYWREFYYNIANEYPRILEHDLNKKNLNLKYNKVKWTLLKDANEKQKQLWKKLLTSSTGLPIIDACMKELTLIGGMHNRARLIVSNFIVKALGFHWCEGELLFAIYLYDYSPILNNLNWGFISSVTNQWAFFRTLNPWVQQKKFDEDCTYIKKYIPQLKNVPTKDIHNWYNEYNKYKDINYPPPMIDFDKAWNKMYNEYKKALN